MLASGIALPGFTSTCSPATTSSPTREALRREDVGLLAVGILDQRDEGGAVGIVLQPLDLAGTSNLRRLKSTMR